MFSWNFIAQLEKSIKAQEDLAIFLVFCTDAGQNNDSTFGVRFVPMKLAYGDADHSGYTVTGNLVFMELVKCGIRIFVDLKNLVVFPTYGGNMIRFLKLSRKRRLLFRRLKTDSVLPLRHIFDTEYPVDVRMNQSGKSNHTLLSIEHAFSILVKCF